MRIRLWARFSRVFRRFLLSYLIVLLLPLIAGYASYRTSIDVAKSDSIENGKMNLNLSKEIVERRLAEVEAFTKQLAVNTELNRLIVDPKPFNPNDAYELGRMQRSLAGFANANDYLANFMIYIRKYGVVLTPRAVYYHPEHYYELNQMGEMSFAEWQEAVLNRTHASEILPLTDYTRNDGNTAPRRTSAITVLQSLPINSFSEPLATAAIMIDESKLGDTLEPIVRQYGGWALIQDREGRTIVAKGIGIEDDPNLSSDGRLRISIRSEKNGWLYTAGIPEAALMDRANTIKRATGLFTLGASLLALSIMLLLAYRNSAPIHRLLSVFREQSGSFLPLVQNEYDFLAGNISHLIVSNKQLETDLRNQLPLLRDTFVKRLLTGDIHSLREIEALSEQTGIAIGEGRGYVGILQIKGYGGVPSADTIQELSVARLLLQQALLAMNPGLLVTDRGSDKLAVIFPNRLDEPELQRLISSVYEQYRLSVNVGLGSRYDNPLHGMSRSYNEALQALEYAVYVEAEGVIRYEDTIRESGMYEYPLETEYRLMQKMTNGESEEASRIVTQLFASNFESKELSYEMSLQFVSELKATLLKFLDQSKYRNEAEAEAIRQRVASIQASASGKRLRRAFESLAREIGGIAVRRRSDMHNDTVRSAVGFIGEQYRNPNLTSYQIAEAMGTTEKYLSQLFKECTGEYLSEYVERLRIRRAYELLADTELTIDEIADRVGYNSPHSFRRAFKRVKGVSPSEYRLTAGGIGRQSPIVRS